VCVCVCVLLFVCTVTNGVCWLSLYFTTSCLLNPVDPSPSTICIYYLDLHASFQVFIFCICCLKSDMIWVFAVYIVRLQFFVCRV